MAFPGKPVLRSGTVLQHRYVIQHTINSGGFGNVYLALDQDQHNSEVAVKEAFYSDDTTRRQFRIEAEVLIAASHPNIVRGFADFEDNGYFYLVMEYIPGLNLEEMQIAHFKSFQGPLAEERALSIMAPICDAADWLHGQGVLHRDVKPANIKLDQRDQPILLDLGLAKLYQIDQRTRTAAQAYTPGYAPPEQCDEDGHTTARSDVYALGATLYYALTGRQPDDAVKRLQNTSFRRVESLPFPSQRTSQRISPATDALVMRALELNPDLRFPTAAALAQAIRAALAALVVVCGSCGQTVEAADFCSHCGRALRRPVAAAALTPAPAASPVRTVNKGRALDVLNRLNRPEAMPTRRIIPPRRRRTFRSGLTLFLGVASLIPALGFLFLFVLPLGISALVDINRAPLLKRGRGLVILGMLLSLAGLAELVYIITSYSGILK